MKKLILICTLFLSFVTCYSADIFWTGSTSESWHTSANWQGNVLPGSNDVAVFESTHNVNVIVTSNASVKGIRVELGYTGTITQSGATLTVGTSGYVYLAKSLINSSADITLKGYLENDNGSFTYTIDSQPQYGVLTISGTNAHYQPNANYYGLDTFTYHVYNGTSNSPVVTVKFTVDDNQEVNDTSATAKDLTTALTAANDNLILTNLAIIANNLDWFKFTVTERSELDLLFLFSPGNGDKDLDVYLYNSSLSVIGQGETGNDNEQIIINDLPIGTYYIKVMGWAGATNLYEMRLVRTTYDPDDRFEVNDTQATAANLTTALVDESGQLFENNLNIISNNVDFYKVTLSGVSNLIASLTFTHASGNLDLQITDSNGTVLGTADTTTNNESLTLNSLAAGDYFIKVYGVASAQNVYNMVAQASVYFTEDTYEANDTKATAWNITSDIINGNLQIDNLRLNSYNEDWFKFTISAESVSSINVLFTPGNGEYDLDIALENDAGTVLAEGLSGSPNENLSLTLAPGTYYLQVYGWSNSHNDYALNMVFTPTNQAPTANNQSVSVSEDNAINITLTGSDPESQPLTYTVTSSPANGILTGTGTSQTYTPNANFNGTDFFTFTVSDGVLTSATATISITINPINDTPTAQNQTVTVIYNSANSFALNSNDIDGDTLTFTIDVQPLHGVLTINGTSANYQPTANYYGSDVFTYHVNDASSSSATANVNIKVDDAKEVNDTSTTAKDLTTELNTGNGILNIPNLIILPNNDDWFKFTVTERSEIDILFLFSPGNGDKDLDVYLYNSSLTEIGFSETGYDNEHMANHDLAIGTYYIKVIGWNGASNIYEMQLNRTTYDPDDRFEPNDSLGSAADLTTNLINSYGQLFENELNILTNNEDFYKVTLSATSNLLVSLSFVNANGNLALEILNSIGTVLGTSNTTTNAESLNLNSLVAGDYIIKVYGVAGAQNEYSMVVQAPIYIPEDSYEPNDTKATAWDITSSIISGNLQINSLRLNSFNEDWFKFTLSATASTNIDVLFTPGNGEFDLDVSLENTAGTVLAQGLSGNQDENLSLNLPAGTYYLKVYGWSNAHNNYALNMVFGFTGNQAPTAFNQNISVNEDNNLNITMVGQDPETQPLTYTVVDNPLHGALTGTGNSRTYTPVANYYGPDSFTFYVSDGTQNSNTATINITVLPVNDAPVAVTEALFSNGSSVLFDVVVNDTDIENTPLNIISVTTPLHGTATIENNQIRYIATVGYVGPDSFSYTVSDGDLTSSVEDIITVNPPDYFPPVVQSVSIPSAQTIYYLGNTLDIVVTFDIEVTVTGVPSLLLLFQNGTKSATYTSGTSTTEIHFAYTVQAGDSAPAPMNYVDINSLQLNGGTMSNSGNTSVAANLTLPATNLNTSLLSEAIVIDAANPSLTVNIPGGAYNNFKEVIFTPINISGGTIKVYYTTNGSVPTTSSPFVDSSTNFKVLVNQDLTLKAFVSNGTVSSSIITNDYTFIKIELVRQQSKLYANKLSGNIPCYWGVDQGNDYSVVFDDISYDNGSGVDIFDNDEHVTRMNLIIFNFGQIKDAGTLILSKDGVTLYSKVVANNEIVNDIILDISAYLGDITLKAYIDNSDNALENNLDFLLTIDRDNDYSESGSFHPYLTGIAKCTESFATTSFELNVQGDATPEVGSEWQRDFAHTIVGATYPLETIFDRPWVYSWSYSSQSSSVPIVLPNTSFGFSRYSFDRAGNLKRLLKGQYTRPASTTPVYGNVSYERKRDGYTISISESGQCGDNPNSGDLPVMTPNQFYANYMPTVTGLQNTLSAGGCIKPNDFTVIESNGYYSIDGTMSYTVEPCFTYKSLPPETAGLKSFLGDGCTMIVTFEDLKDDLINDVVVEAFEAESIRIDDFPDVIPVVPLDGKFATFTIPSGQDYTNAKVARVPDGDSELDSISVTREGKSGKIENTVFAKCGISFEYSFSGATSATLIIATPAKVELDLEGSQFTSNKIGNQTFIIVSQASGFIDLSFSNRGGEMKTTDAVTVSIDMPGCQNFQIASYTIEGCGLNKNHRAPNVTTSQPSFSQNPTSNGTNLNPFSLASIADGNPVPGTVPIPNEDHPIVSTVSDTSGRVTDVTFADGTHTTYAYNDVAKSVTETNSDGIASTFFYDPTFTRVIKKTIGSSLLSYTYEYNASGETTRIATLENNVEVSVQTFEFDGSNNLIKRTDPDGTFELWSDNGTTKTHTDKFGNVDTRTYDSQQRLISTSNHSGSTVYQYGPVLIKDPNEFTLEITNDPTSSKAEFAGEYITTNNGASYFRNYLGNNYTIDDTSIKKNNVAVFTFTSRPDPLELFDDAVYQAGTVIATTKFPKEQRLLSITFNNPESTIIKYAKKTYNVKGILSSTESRLTTNLNETPYHIEYVDFNGNVASTSFLRDSVVQNQPGAIYTYNSKGMVTNISQIQPDNVTYAETIYTYETVSGQEDLVKTETNALGKTVYYIHDSMRRVIQVYGNTARPGVTSYTPTGKIATFECKQASVSNPNSFGPTHYKEIYTYSFTDYLMTKTTQNASGTESVSESYTYDAQGRQDTHTDANGIVSKTIYNGIGQVVQKIRDFGSAPHLNISTSYTYNAKGQLEDTIFEGKTTRNIYDSFGRQTSVIIDPNGLNITQVSYTFDSQWRQKTMTDAMGNVTTYNYNQLGQQFQTVNALGVVSESVFDGAGNVIRRIEDAGVGKLNATTEFFFDTLGRQFKTVSAVGQTYQREDRVEFDLNSNAVKQIEDFTGFARVTTMEFDDLGNQIKTRLDPDAPAYTGLKIINQSTYNEIGQMITSTAPNGLVTEYNYNYLGRQTSTIVDPTGLAITNSTIYDNAGNVTQTTDAGGLIVTVVYDALSRQGTQTVDPGGKNIISKTFYNRDGTVDKTINPEGVVTKNNYNTIGQRISTIVDEGVTNITTQFQYNLIGNITTIIDPLTKTATRGYDALNRSVASTDAKGNISRVIYDNLNRPITSIDALGVQTVTNYNLLNQVTSQTVDPTGLNQTSSMEYDSLGRTTKVIKANTVQEVFEYDLADRKTKSIEDPTGLNIITQYEFNNLSQMTKVIDAKSKATQYAYNTLGQLTTETYADAGIKSYTYNSIGQRVTQTDQNNNQFGYLYDNLYRLTTVNVIPGAGVSGTTQQVFEYDNLSRLTVAKDFVGANVNEVIRDYNTLGRLETETQIIGLTSRTVAKQYNLVGRVSQLTYPNGRVNSYTFDNNHLPYTTTSSSTVVATYQFNAVNAPVTKTLGNNVSLNIEYNNRYQITTHDWKLNGNTITGYNYGHDSVGNRLYSENLVTSNKSEHFAFDNADRLISFKTGTLNGTKDNIVAPTYSQSWNLDSIGNWVGFTDNGTSSTNTFSDTHEMTTFKGVTNTFDNNGNLIFDGIRTFKYDAFNRIIEVKVSSIVLAEYQYDVFNRRVMKKVDADLNGSFETTVKYLYDGFRCIEELNGSDALVNEFVYGSLYIDEVILQRTGATDYYFTHDYRYSVTSLTNLSGNIVESYDYKVYGERTASGSGLTDVGYTGQRHDSETGLMYFKNRYYSTSMGSFVTRDPYQKDPNNRMAMDGYHDGMSLYLGYFGATAADALGFWKLDRHEKITKEALKSISCFKKCWNKKCREEIERGLVEGSKEPDVPNGWTEFLDVFGWVEFNVGFTAFGYDVAGIQIYDDITNTLTYQSHFGNSQWWHAMVSNEKSGKEIVDKMVNLTKQRAADFNNDNGCFSSGKALGFALHTIEDSFSRSHVERDLLGRIKRFQGYPSQDSHKHGEADKEDDSREYSMAVKAVKEILQMVICQKESGLKLENYLRNKVFRLGRDVKLGGSAEEFKK